MVCRSSLRFSAPKNALTSDALMQYHHLMRTTLDIESDVLSAAKEMAKRDGETTGRVISRLVRKAICGGGEKPLKIEYRNGVPVISTGDEIITMEHIRSIMDDEGI